MDLGGLKHLIALGFDKSPLVFCLAEFLRARIYSIFESYSLSYSLTEALRSIFPEIMKLVRLDERVGIA